MNAQPPGSKGRAFDRRPAADDVEREIAAHLAMRAQELVDEGWDPAAARAEAERVFGNREAVVRACRRITNGQVRATRRAHMLDAFRQDLKFGFRLLIKSPVFTLVAVVTLAIGIGANTAVFSVVNGVLLHPLRFDNPEQLVWVREVNNRGGPMAAAWMNFVDWEQESSSFAGLTAYNDWNTTVLGADRPLNVRVANVSRSFWDVFRVRPYRGRLTNAADHVIGAEPVLVVSQGFWENQLGATDLAGVVLEISGVRAPVVGVVPAGFDFPSETQIWAAVEPLGAASTSRTSHNWNVVGRLREGLTLAQANLEMDALTKVLVQREADGDPDFLATGASVIGLQDEVIGDAGGMLLLLFGAAGLVLLVACTNLASTLLARGNNRARELAVRASLGAGQKRIVRQLLTESVLLALLGGLVGVGLAVVLRNVLTAWGAAFIPRLEEVGVDGMVLLYSFGIALTTALVFGLVPALQLTRDERGTALRAGSRGNTVDHRAGIWRFLVGTEVALALVLLVGSGLLIRSFQTLLSEDPGFDASDVTTAAINLSGIKYPNEQDHARYYTELLDELAAQPGVKSAGVLSTLPASGSIPNGRVELDGDLNKQAIAEYVVASSGAFEALDIPLRAGRLFNRGDTPESQHVAIVSESFAREAWPGEDPIGKQVNGGGMDNFWEERTFARVVGVVGDVRFRDLARAPESVVYFPYTQRPFRIQWRGQVVVESATGNPATVAGPLRSTIQRLDSDVPILLATQTSLVKQSLAARRFSAMLLSGFAAIALVLAAVGIYGVVSFAVARRAREMGIRLALGAAPRDVRRMVVTSAMRLVAGGVVVGLIGAVVGTRVMASSLYGVSPTDPITFVAVIVTIGATALLASWLPARMGTRVDPVIAMRAE